MSARSGTGNLPGTLPGSSISDFPFPEHDNNRSFDAPLEGMPEGLPDTTPDGGISFTQAPSTEVTIESPQLTITVKSSAVNGKEILEWAEKVFANNKPHSENDKPMGFAA